MGKKEKKRVNLKTRKGGEGVGMVHRTGFCKRLEGSFYVLLVCA